MGLTALAYARMMKALLPPGRLWRLEPDSVLSQVLLGAADELLRIEGRGADLIEESDPQTADELLPDFERVLGLSSDGTLAERRARVVSKLVFRQRVRPADYRLALAPLLGQDVADVDIIERGRAFAVLVDDDHEIYRFFVYRDPDLPGSYDLDAAQELIDSISHSHTKGYVIESIDFRCEDEFSLCDRDLLGV